MALVTTFATTPITIALFPPWYQKKLTAWKRGEIDWDGNHLVSEDGSGDDGGFSMEKDQSSEIRRLLVCLRLDSLPSLFTFVALLVGDGSAAVSPKAHPTKNRKGFNNDSNADAMLVKRPLEVHGVRMLELTDRLSSVMKEAEADELATRDPVVNAFHTFGQLSNVAVSGEVHLVPEGEYSSLLSDRAADRKSDMILLPWSDTGNFSEAIITNTSDPQPPALSNGNYNHFVSKFLDGAPCNSAIFVNKGFGSRSKGGRPHLNRIPTGLSLISNPPPVTVPVVDRSHHIFFPFIGGDDDRVALRFVLKLARNPNVTATILHIKASNVTSEAAHVIGTAITKNDTSIATSAEDPSFDRDRTFFTAMADSLAEELQARVLFDTIDSTEPVHDAIAHARTEVGQAEKNAGDLVIVGRRHGGILDAHLNHLPGQEGHMRSSLGVLAEKVILDSVKASVLVIQAGRKDL